MCLQFTEHWLLYSTSLWTLGTQGAPFQISPSFFPEHWTQSLCVHSSLFTFWSVQAVSESSKRKMLSFNFCPFFSLNTDHNSYVFKVHWSLYSGSLWTQGTQGAPFQIFHFFFPRTLNRIFMCSQSTEHWSLCSGTLWTKRTHDALFQILSFIFPEHWS